MTPEAVQILVAVLTVIGTAGSAFAGVLIANSKTIYRIGLLEKKVEVHNSAVTRLTILEQSCIAADKRISRIEEKVD